MQESVYSLDEIKSIIKPIAEKYLFKSVFLFGSYARGEANGNSDIDIMIDTTGTDIDSLFKLGEVYEEISSAFSKPIDLITLSSLEQTPIRQSEMNFRNNILRERVSLYAVA